MDRLERMKKKKAEKERMAKESVFENMNLLIQGMKLMYKDNQ